MNFIYLYCTKLSPHVGTITHTNDIFKYMPTFLLLLTLNNIQSLVICEYLFFLRLINVRK